MAVITNVMIARKNGIVSPMLALRAAHKAGIPYAVACALLEQESAGGENVWGHDPTWMVGYPILDEETYGVYKAHRDHFGSQGVGPCQLTYHTYQDEADDLGGCWLPFPNMVVGFKILRSSIDHGLTLHEAFRSYNGSEAYAVMMDARVDKWRKLLGGTT